MLANDSLVSEPFVPGPMVGSSNPEPVAPEAAPRDAAEARPVEAKPVEARTIEARPVEAEGDRQAALRALRNLEATEARLERNAKRDVEEARGKLIQELLPVLDNLDRTIRAAHGTRNDPAMLEGIRLVRHQLDGVLRGYGVERIEALDHRFDPGLHEAIGMTAVADPRRHGVVVQQAEPGYRFAGKLLRPAKVSVGKFVAPAQTGFRPLWR